MNLRPGCKSVAQVALRTDLELSSHVPHDDETSSCRGGDEVCDGRRSNAGHLLVVLLRAQRRGGGRRVRHGQRHVLRVLALHERARRRVTFVLGPERNHYV